MASLSEKELRFLVLEELEHAKKRGARIYAELTGYGASSDAYHLASPAENGEGAYRAMQAAAEDAQTSASEIQLISAHATSDSSGRS